MNAVAEALNRVADALFQCAKEQRKQSKLQEVAVHCSELMCEAQLANLDVTRQLEAALQGQVNASRAN